MPVYKSKDYAFSTVICSFKVRTMINATINLANFFLQLNFTNSVQFFIHFI